MLEAASRSAVFARFPMHKGAPARRVYRPHAALIGGRLVFRVARRLDAVNRFEQCFCC